MSNHIPTDKNGHNIWNTQPVTCSNCGQTAQPGDAYRVENWDYPWDGSDMEGSVTQMLDFWYEHPLSIACLKAACESGHNLDFLRSVARGSDGTAEFGPTWREMARQAYNEEVGFNREIAEMQAKQEDDSLREAGFGVIGGHYDHEGSE